MRRLWTIAAVVVALGSVPRVAEACGVDLEAAPQPTPSDRLLAQAVELERTAQSNQAQAAALEQGARRLDANAQDLRVRSRFAGEFERVQFIENADDLHSAATEARAEAARHRADARELLRRARLIRDEALRVLQGNRGWHGVPGRAPVVT